MDDLTQLIAALHAAFTTPPDDDPLRTVQGRVAAFGRLRDHGYSIREAAWHVGVCRGSGHRYEALLRQQRGAA